MSMLIFETFLLMFGSALLGWSLGGLLAEAFADDVARLTGDDPPEPWLNDLAPLAPAPVLPPRPDLLSDAERARLVEQLQTLHAPAVEPSPAAAPAPEAAPAALEPAPPVEAAVAAAPDPEPPTIAEPAPIMAPAPESPAIAEADAARAAEADAHGTRPLGLVAARDGKADDLKRIKGIGRQNEARLNALGVWHFDQIAAWTPENIRWAGSFLAFVGRIDREDWVGQAKILAAGGVTEFAGRVDAGEVPTSSAQ